ncbi:MAG: DUF4973 domain-containing protein [Candidatus Symbiothrix sp.]|nr:DUF4973 domain-containing protein [Candidatus Symbiothrix sp.]
MKKIQLFLYTALACFFFSSCNEEWKDELFEKAVSFENSGVTNVYLKYSSKGGVISYKIPVLVNGTTQNSEDIQVTVALDPDTLNLYNIDRFRSREDLYFKQLAPQHYEFQSMTGTIHKGEDVGFVDVNFKLDGLDLVEKYILPLQITQTSAYGINQRKHYKKTLMQIVPFNDYSGSYSATTMEIWNNPRIANEVSQNVPNREARVVDENTIFFYAGTIEHEARDREAYKVFVQFSQTDSTVVLTAADPTINFAYTPAKCYYKVNTKMDEIQPYLEKKYTTLYLDYKYDDITTPGYPLHYAVEGNMTLERKRNILIPDEDQQEIF